MKYNVQGLNGPNIEFQFNTSFIARLNQQHSYVVHPFFGELAVATGATNFTKQLKKLFTTRERARSELDEVQVATHRYILTSVPMSTSHMRRWSRV